jgi:hypothetical protein
MCACCSDSRRTAGEGSVSALTVSRALQVFIKVFSTINFRTSPIGAIGYPSIR